MFTRCPGCQSIYRLNASALAESAGVVRCGQCGKTFNALSHLFEAPPVSDQAPLNGSGIPPLLEDADVHQTELPWPRAEAGPPAQPGPVIDFEVLDTPDSQSPTHWGWKTATLALAAALAIQLYLQWQTPGSVLDRLTGNGITTSSDPTGLIQVVSRDMHRHPSLDDAVIVSATLRNPTEHHLEWPIVEVRLYDPSQQVLGVRRLNPEDYLGNDRAIDRGMAPNVIVPLVMEFVVGTTDPSGFDFRFLY
jgi:predicted Zn finger-like uncharacterized protein